MSYSGHSMPLSTVLWFVTHAAVLALMVLAAWTAGWFFTRRVEFDSSLERSVFTIAIGLGICAVALLGVGALGLLRPPLVFALTVAVALPSALRLALNIWRTNSRPSARALLLGFVALVLWSFFFFQTLFPPMRWDALSHHLVFAREQLRAHGVSTAIGTPHAVMPALNHYLFVWAMALSDDVAAQGTQHLLFVLAAMGMVAWGKRFGSLASGMTGAALWLSHPLVLALSESTYVDVGTASIAFLAIYAIGVGSEKRSAEWLKAGMALAGMAAASKMFSGIFLAMAGLFCLFLWFRRTLKTADLVRALASGAFFSLPWYLLIAWATGGNPIWPIKPEWSSGVWAQIPGFPTGGVGLPVTVMNFAMFPLKMATEPLRFGPDFYLGVNPIVAIWPLAWLIAFRDRRVRWWTLWAIVYSVFWFSIQQYVRYWIPALPLVAMSIAESIRWLCDRKGVPRAVKAAAFASLIIWSSFGFGQHLQRAFERKGWPPTTAAQRVRFHEGTLPGYGAARYINERAQAGDTTYLLNAGYLNYTLNTRVIDFFGVIASPRIMPHFDASRDREWLDRLDRWSVDWLLIRHQDAEWLRLPERNLVRDPYWPGFRLAYQDSVAWVFQRSDAPDSR